MLLYHLFAATECRTSGIWNELPTMQTDRGRLYNEMSWKTHKAYLPVQDDRDTTEKCKVRRILLTHLMIELLKSIRC